MHISFILSRITRLVKIYSVKNSALKFGFRSFGGVFRFEETKSEKRGPVLDSNRLPWTRTMTLSLKISRILSLFAARDRPSRHNCTYKSVFVRMGGKDSLFFVQRLCLINIRRRNVTMLVETCATLSHERGLYLYLESGAFSESLLLVLRLTNRLQFSFVTKSR